MIKLLFKEKKVGEFKELLGILNKPQLIAKALLVFPKEIASKKGEKLEDIYGKIEDEIPAVLKFVDKGEISERDLKKIFFELAEGKNLKYAIKSEKADISELEEVVAKLVKEKPGLSENAYMGLVMGKPEFKGKVDGREVKEIIRKFRG